jgi:hypothetical protein
MRIDGVHYAGRPDHVGDDKGLIRMCGGGSPESLLNWGSRVIEVWRAGELEDAAMISVQVLLLEVELPL